MKEKHATESKRLEYISAGIVLVSLILLFLQMQGYLHHRIEPGALAETSDIVQGLNVFDVKIESIQQYESVVGTVTSRKDTIISAKIPAHVKSIHIRPGDFVKAADLLVVLDDRDIKAKLGQARSGLTSANAARIQAESAFNRYKTLRGTGAATQAEYESAKAQFEMSAAKVNEAGKVIEELEVMLDYTEIRAPYSGRVVDKMVTAGSLATPGVPLLRMEDPELLRLEVFIPESRARNIKTGRQFVVEIETLNKKIPGQVDEIVPRADPRSRSFLVRISLEPDAELRSGMFGRCFLPMERRDSM